MDVEEAINIITKHWKYNKHSRSYFNIVKMRNDSELTIKLATLIEENNEKNKGTFPVKTFVYLHSSKESMIEKGEELNLCDDAIENFMSCCYELKVEIEVSEDGKYKILGVSE